MSTHGRELLAALRAFEKGKIVSAREAVQLIQDGDTVATGGFVGIGFAENIAVALEARFLETSEADPDGVGQPHNLTLVYAAGQGDCKERGLSHPGYERLMRRQRAAAGGRSLSGRVALHHLWLSACQTWLHPQAPGLGAAHLRNAARRARPYSRQLNTMPLTTDHPAEVPVQEQLDAYNAHDVQRFVACYTEDVQVFRLPGTAPVMTGRAAMAEHYSKHRFNIPTLHAELVNRMVMGNKVIDHERIHGVREAPYEAAAIYEVQGGLIKTVWFLNAD
jgi:hypothetical protein